jgi:hypothetical protein
MLLFGALALGACKVDDHDSFDTPTDTLLTFQAKLARDDPQSEYTCLSERFKDRCQGLLGYLTARDKVLDEKTLERFLISRNDLRDNIVSEKYSPDQRQAKLDVDVWGTPLAFYFRKEVLLRLKFADGTGQDTFLDLPAADVYRLSGKRMSFDLEGLELEKIDPRALRATEVRELWKIDGFERREKTEERASQPEARVDG